MHNERGNVGLAVVWLVSLAFFLSTSFLPAVLTQNRLQARSGGNLAALAVAEAGAELAIWEFRNNQGQFLTTGSPAPWTNFTGSECSITSQTFQTAQTCPAGQTCRCLIFPVTTNITGITTTTGTATILVKDIGWTTQNATRILSAGAAKDSGVSTTLTITLAYNSTIKPFERAIFANGNILLTQSANVLSYDSGTTFPISPIACVPGGSPPCSADVESNSGNLSLDGSSTKKSFINGTAYLDGGLSHDAYSRVNPDAINANYLGLPDLQLAQSAGHAGATGDILFPPVQEQPPANPCGSCVAPACYIVASNPPSSTVYSHGDNKTYCASSGLSVLTNIAITISGNNNTLYVNGPLQLTGGGSLDFGGGTVRTNAVTISGNGSQLYVRQKTDFYAKGQFNVGSGADMNNSGTITTARKPGYLRLYIQKSLSSDSVNISSNSSENYATIYAPGMNVVLGGGADLHGAVIGETVTLDGSTADIVYDTQLRNITDWPAWLTEGILGGGGGAGNPNNVNASVTSWTRSN